MLITQVEVKKEKVDPDQPSRLLDCVWFEDNRLQDRIGRLDNQNFSQLALLQKPFFPSVCQLTFTIPIWILNIRLIKLYPTDLDGIKYPLALASLYGSTGISCKLALFRVLDISCRFFVAT